MFVVMTFIALRKKDEPLRLDLVAISAVLWTIGGLAFGLAIWTVSEKKYQKYLRESEPKDGDPPKID
jgi:predicted membrane channel-forming protein YqfA (hemolysin III family)